mmetsp:Transcript_958/g.1121  ORF Transcript_958/g.1121 Transcript_958/m.1121 type:complete len:286 (+) Transcript_958:6745-7602(+)
MSRSRRKTHDEDGTSRKFTLYLAECGLHVAVVINNTDTLPTTTFTCLDHHRHAKLFDLFSRHLYACDICRVVQILRDGSSSLVIRLQLLSVPRNCRYLCTLSNDGGTNFVSKRIHRSTRRSHKNDIELVKRVWKPWVFTRMTPASPNSIDLVLLSNLNNQIYIGIIVDVGSTRNVANLVSVPNVLRVRHQILWSCHGDKLNHAFIVKGRITPASDGSNKLDSGDTIIGQQHLPEDLFPVARLDKGLQGGESLQVLVGDIHLARSGDSLIYSTARGSVAVSRGRGL